MEQAQAASAHRHDYGAVWTSRPLLLALLTCLVVGGVMAWGYRPVLGSTYQTALKGRRHTRGGVMCATETAMCTMEALAAYQNAADFPLERLCAATPWLLPPRTPALSYTNISNEDELLELRAQPFGKHKGTISIFLFSKALAGLAQNYVYTLVRFAGVTNYVAVTWTPGDHAACLDLNLPCWDIARFLPAVVNGSNEALFGSAEFRAMSWLKPALVAHLLDRGFVVHVSDVDVAYSTKPLWESYITYIEEAGADGAMAEEAHVGGNTGNYVLLDSPGGRAFARMWADAASYMSNLNDQKGMGMLQAATHSTSHTFCRHPAECHKARVKAGRNGANTAIIRHYTFPQCVADADYCWLADERKRGRLILDPCHRQVLYIHPICMAGAGNKIAALKATGWWLMDDSGTAADTLPRYRPLKWKYEHLSVEDKFWSCGIFSPGLI